MEMYIAEDELDLVLLVMCAMFMYINILELLFDDENRMWTKEIYTEQERKLKGFFNKTFKTIKERDEGEFRKVTRMGVAEFNLLLNLLKDRLIKYSNRPSIEAECRLALTLMYLSQGCCKQVLAWSFRMGITSVHRIIYETCEAIWEELHSTYLAVPNEYEWKNISHHFQQISGMPNCVGAIDGKHVNIICPPKSGSQYFNYKGHHSVVLLASCDANYLFTFVDIGACGSESDGGIFAKSIFGKQILQERLNLPPACNLPESDISFPHYFVADAAFPLRRSIMRPYPGRLLAEDKDHFNNKLSSARRLIENTFGIMCARWRILTNTLHCHPKNAISIVKAIVVLHNFVKLHDTSYCPRHYVDHIEDEVLIEGLWRTESTPLQSVHYGRGHNSRREAFDLRDTLKNYLFNKRLNNSQRQNDNS